MKQLKFNPDKDMKELGKYGFRFDKQKCFWYIDRSYFDERYAYQDSIYITNDGIVRVYGSKILIILWELIKENLLVVESDEDE